MRDLKGRVAVITGGAGGLGRALAVELAGRGCTLALADNRAEALAEAAALVPGAKVSTHLVDVGSREQVVALRDKVTARHGSPALLINAAGICIIGTLTQHTPEELDQALGSNLLGAVWCCHAFLPAMVRAGEGHLVNISSMLGFVGMPSQSTYALTKFGLRGLSESLRGEVAAAGIGVTGVYPGAMRTAMVLNPRGPMAEAARPMLESAAKTAVDPAVAARRIVRAIEKNQARLVIGADARLFDWVSRLAPGLLASLAGRQMKALLRPALGP